jgi:hypothetical protein
VPAITSVVASWARALDETVGNDANEAWTEELLEKIKENGGRLKIVLQVCSRCWPFKMGGALTRVQVTDGRKTTVWNNTANAFEICFTKRAESVHQLSMMMTGNFHSDLLGAFKPAASEGGATHKRGPSAAAADPSTAGWVDAGRDDASDFDAASIMTPATTSAAAMAPMAVRSAAPVNDRLPQVGMIDRPEELLQRPPYFLFIRSMDQKLVVQGSHQPSLELLADYLKKWGKTNQQLHNRVSVVRIAWTRETLTAIAASAGGGPLVWIPFWDGHDLRPD